MKIGTWNMDGGYSTAHTGFLEAQDCEVLLLTEVSSELELQGYDITRTVQAAVVGVHWSAIASREEAVPFKGPHPTTCASRIGPTTFVASVLPWAGSGGKPPWSGRDHPERMASALSPLKVFLWAQEQLVWGGDWNQSLTGDERAGSLAGREQIIHLMDQLGLRAPTADLKHPIAGLRTIDHIALADPVQEARQVLAEVHGRRLSDHDFYQVTTMTS